MINIDMALDCMMGAFLNLTLIGILVGLSMVLIYLCTIYPWLLVPIFSWLGLSIFSYRKRSSLDDELDM